MSQYFWSERTFAVVELVADDVALKSIVIAVDCCWLVVALQEFDFALPYIWKSDIITYKLWVQVNVGKGTSEFEASVQPEFAALAFVASSKMKI